MTETDRLARAQRVLNVAWIAAGIGWLSAFLGMTFGIPFGWMLSWLVLCAVVAIVATIASIITYTHDR